MMLMQSIMGCYYSGGEFGLPLNVAKALELWHRAGELGDEVSYYLIGTAYKDGRGVERDEQKAKHYWELAAMGGDAKARNNLGCKEWQAGKLERALRHWMIAVNDGNLNSLGNIKKFYLDSHATKDDYTKAMRSYQAYLVEITTDQRDEAVAFSDEYKYYESGL